MTKVEVKIALLNLFDGNEITEQAATALFENNYTDENGQLTGYGKAMAHRAINNGINYTSVARNGRGTNCVAMLFAAADGLRFQVEDKNYIPSEEVRTGLDAMTEDLIILRANLPAIPEQVEELVVPVEEVEEIIEETEEVTEELN